MRSYIMVASCDHPSGGQNTLTKMDAEEFQYLATHSNLERLTCTDREINLLYSVFSNGSSLVSHAVRNILMYFNPDQTPLTSLTLRRRKFATLSTQKLPISRHMSQQISSDLCRVT